MIDYWTLPLFAKIIQSFILIRDGIGGSGGGGLANIECCLKFLEYALTRDISSKVTPDVDFIDEVVNQCYVPVVKIFLETVLEI